MTQTFHGTYEDMGVNGPTLRQYLADNWQAIITQWAGANPPENPSQGQPWLDISEDWGDAVLKFWNGSEWVLANEYNPYIEDLKLSRFDKDTLWQFLQVAHNSDGTLKSSQAENLTEWVNSALPPTYVSANEFSVTGDQTDIFVANRRVKVTLDESVVYSAVQTSSYDSGNDVTNVTIYDSVLESTLQKIEYGLVKSGSEGSLPRLIASIINYDNTASGLSATEVQAALDELESEKASQSFQIDSFGDYLIDAAPAAGENRIPANADKVTFSKTKFDNNNIAILNPSDSVTVDFKGVALALITKLDTNARSVDVSIDGGAASSVSLGTTDIDTDSQLVELASGLSYADHTVEIINTSTDVDVYIIAFDVIETTDRSAENESGFAYFDSDKVEITAGTTSLTTPTTARADLLSINSNGDVVKSEGTDGQSVKAFRVEEDGIISDKYVDYPEQLSEMVQTWNSGITGDKQTGWEKEKNIGHSSNFALVVEGYDSQPSYYIGFWGIGLDLITRTGDLHGVFDVSVDGGAPFELDLYDTTHYTYQNSLNIVSGLDVGHHEVKLTATNKDPNGTGSSQLFCHIDAFDIYLPDFPDLPAGNQPLARAIPMPDPASMSSIPAQPTSAEEKGWIRYDANICSYIGSGWVKLYASGAYNNTRHYSNTVDDCAEYTFFGSEVRLVCHRDTSHGIAGVSIDGGAETNVDLYASSTKHQEVVYENTGLSVGFHTIKIRVTGTKNASSANTFIVIDAFEVHRPLLLLEDTRITSPIQADLDKKQDTLQYALIQDQKAPGTNGGTFTSGAWRTRDLNAIVKNEGGWASLENNQITLQPGKYFITASAPVNTVDRHSIRLFNITDNKTQLSGTSKYAGTSSGSSDNDSVIKNSFSITGLKKFEIQHKCNASRTTDGFGAASNFDKNEIYTQVEIIRLGDA